MAARGDQRWAVTFAIVLVVTVLALLGVAGLRLAQMRSAPMAFAEAAPSAGGAGPQDVRVSADAWLDPSGPAVTDLLNRYFDAINRHDYAAWTTTVSPDMVAAYPQTAWEQSYRSTQDGSIRLARIDQVGPGRLLAMVSFVSTQDPALAPSSLQVSRICWRVTYPLVGTPPKIDHDPHEGDTLRGGC